MFEIIKTLIISLTFAGTGAGIAWSVTSDAKQSLPSLGIERAAAQSSKGDRLDPVPAKGDRLVAQRAVSTGGIAVVIDSPATTSSIILQRS
ncbi:MAG: hypothetical protein ACJ8AS_09765 [Hyphomicrobiales bacterium]